jgi:RNA polymerase sigma-70 factor, ECF subfamily
MHPPARHRRSTGNGEFLAAEPDNAVLEPLLRRCAAKESRALDELYRSTAPLLLAVLVRMLRVRAQAEDALQDVYVRIWQQASQFDGHKGRAMAWMVSIARNRAIDLQRTQRATVMLDAAELAGAEQLRVAAESDTAEFSTASRALQRCLELLGGAQKRCLVLAYQHGLTQDKIALSTGEALGTVKSWMRRGLQSLKMCMES